MPAKTPPRDPRGKFRSPELAKQLIFLSTSVWPDIGAKFFPQQRGPLTFSQVMQMASEMTEEVKRQLVALVMIRINGEQV